MSHRGSQPATARHEDAPQCYDPGEPRLTDEEWDKVNGIKNGPPAERPTPITDAADRVIAGETPYEHSVRRSVAMGDLERQLAEATKARDDYFAAWTTCIKKRGDIKQQRDTLARWVKNNPAKHGGDHACAECYPYSDILVEGFQCGYHLALATLDRKEGE